jgi:hypothetical protein
MHLLLQDGKIPPDQPRIEWTLGNPQLSGRQVGAKLE